jgi:DNA-binding MarR family transcriptional regulator
MAEGIGKALETAIKTEPAPAAEKRGRHIFQNSRRRCIFTLLTVNPCLGIPEMAERCGLARNTVKWHLDSLMRSGYVAGLRDGRRIVFYPVGLITKEQAGLFKTINHPQQSRLFREIMAKPGMAQHDLARALGRSRQWVAGALRVLDSSGLVTAVEDGVHTRYYPTRLLPDMADGFYTRSRDFTEHMQRRLGEEGGAPPAVARKGLDRVIMEIGPQAHRFSIEMGVNPYLTCLAC